MRPKKYETGLTIGYKVGGHFRCQVYALAHNKYEGGREGYRAGKEWSLSYGGYAVTRH